MPDTNLSSVVANDDFTINNDGTISVDLSGNSAGTTTIFAQVGANIEQFVMVVEEARRPNTITVVTEPAAEILQGQDGTIQFALLDQYGEEWADADSAATVLTTSIVDVSGDAAVIDGLTPGASVPDTNLSTYAGILTREVVT